MNKRIDPQQMDPVTGSTYPSPYDEPCQARQRWRLGDQAGLSQFGINLVRLPPGAWSSQRHWHAKSDEFVYILEGEATLVTDAGAEVLGPGDCAGFKAGDRDGHCLQNRSDADVVYLEVGTRLVDDEGEYSDIDMKFVFAARPSPFLHKDGTPYAPKERSGSK